MAKSKGKIPTRLGGQACKIGTWGARYAALFRVVQESLTNVHRYSGSANADTRIFNAGGSVHLEIVDYGKGIRAATDRSSFAGAPSLGVGIPGMRERIRQLGGELEVEFEAWGTRVKAALPMGAATDNLAGESDAAPLFGKSAEQNERAPESELRKRILIADDHEVMRRGMGGLVDSQEEWAVCGEAVEGHEAVGKARDLRPDLLILDIDMPGLSGLEAALQTLRDDPDARILFFTVHESPQLIRELSNLGARGYVCKSRAGNDLVDAVRAVLAGKKFFPKTTAAS